MPLIKTGSGIGLLYSPPAAVVSSAATTWNPADKSANMGLSGGDLVATANGNAVGVRSIASVGASQKVYMEYVPTVNANNQVFGFANATYALANNIGTDATGNVCGVSYTGIFECQGSADNNAAMPSWTTGDRVGIAFDNGAKLFWSRVNNGAWSNSGDPVAGTGGRAVSTGGTLYAVVWIAFTTEITTARFASSSWTDSAPSGYTQLA